MFVEWLYNLIFKTILEPIIDFNRKAKKYKKKKEYGKIVIAFLLSLLYELAILFDLAAIIFLIVYFANNHVGIVCAVSGIIFLYWSVKVKYVDEPQQEQTPTAVADESYEALKTYAKNGYNDMRLIVFKTVQTIGEAIGIKRPKMLVDIESIEKYYINNGCVFFIFSLMKENVCQKYTKDELSDALHILENACLELWHKGSYPTIQLQTYTDNSGVILPPISFVEVDDIGTTLQLFVVYTSPAYAEYLKANKQAQNTTGNGYDKDDSRLL